MSSIKNFLSVPGRLKKISIGISVVAVALLLTTRMTRGWFELVGWPVYDAFQRATAKPAKDDVVVVVITQASLDAMRDDPSLKLGWPWPREIYGPFLQTATLLKAKSVTFDLLFDSHSVYGKPDDEAFNEALKKYISLNPESRIVFPAPTSNSFQKPNSDIIKEIDEKIVYGAVNLPLEDDGVYRRVPRAFESPDGKKYPSIGEAAILGRSRIDSGDDLYWPSGRVKSTLLKFYERDTLPLLDFMELLRVYRSEFHDGPKDAAVAEAKKILDGKHWILGVAAPGLYDLRPLPTDERAPGVYVHTTQALNLLHGERVKRTTDWAIAVSALILGIVLAFAVFRPASPRPALLASVLIVMFAIPALSYGLWLVDFWLNPVPFVLAMGGLAIAFLSFRFQTEWKERERFIQSIKNSMSDSMVQLIRSGKLSATRFGDRREISILFSDLSGFTSLAESTDADKLVEILNMYLDECVDLVFSHNGFVDKFIGDAIMALWGAPVVGQNDHAQRAYRTALEYQAAVDRFNTKAREKFGFEGDLFVARVGLHTGHAICGNIGSHTRYNYTAVGDSVNLASRLEGLGKQYDVTLLISEDAVRSAGADGSSEIYLVDQVAVKGRSKPVMIYSSTAGIAPAKIAGYKSAFALYLRREWSAADQAFGQVLEVPPAKIMQRRCQDALKHGELKQLKMGVWHHDEK
jgi:adenylate cyclase